MPLAGSRLSAFIFGWFVLIGTVFPAAAEDDTLIVFVDGASDAALQKAFVEDDLPALESLAEDMEVGFRVFDVAEHGAAPPDVGITPLIAFQNWRGRSIYQGRYATLDRVKNFVRTARFMPQGDEALVREGIPVWDAGRAKVAAPIKVTPVGGPGVHLFSGDEKASYLAAAPRLIAEGMERFDWADRVELGRSDRQWYVNFYPAVNEDGVFSITTELYSQFHCHEPVLVTFDAPVAGPWSRREAILQQTAATLEAEIVRLLDESDLGDGYDFVTVPTKSWDGLGLALPERPAAAAADQVGVELVRSWQIDEAAQDQRPAVQFAFPAPLDGYSGEAGRVSGRLELGEGLALDTAEGRFDADPASVTMGEADLDLAIHGSMLEVAKYPDSFFTFENIDVGGGFAGQPVAFGQVIPAVLHGTFTMKGQSIPLSVPVSVEAFVGGDGRPRLSFDGTWSISLSDPFGIEGPPGPKEASDTLSYRCHIVLMPVVE